MTVHLEDGLIVPGTIELPDVKKKIKKYFTDLGQDDAPVQPSGPIKGTGFKAWVRIEGTKAYITKIEER